ncbi:hypothetical protein CHARACLAT_004906 [Characodon lateralis]|uniref:Uncharacterized protein n=1 Tax=Characodon lateralis TaxID=208331 RepID=A0ABU7CVK4_9TELE|nr:hypothetical protein [Characodon lateralis]
MLRIYVRTERTAGSDANVLDPFRLMQTACVFHSHLKDLHITPRLQGEKKGAVLRLERLDGSAVCFSYLPIQRQEEKMRHGGAAPIFSSLRARGRVHPGQVANPSEGNTETYRTNNHAHTHT